MKRANIVYSGTVQGVGFRFTAEDIANSIGIKGWVQNCPDGTVEVLCEGKEESIESFRSRMKKSMGRYIHRERINWEKPTGEFDSFNIKFYFR